MENNEKRPGKFMGIGIGSGIAIGTGIGVATGNIAMGVSLGVALGVAFGAMLTKMNQKSGTGGHGGTRTPNDLSPNPAEELQAWQDAQKKPRK